LFEYNPPLCICNVKPSSCLQEDAALPAPLPAFMDTLLPVEAPQVRASKRPQQQEQQPATQRQRLDIEYNVARWVGPIQMLWRSVQSIWLSGTSKVIATTLYL